ncbi:APC family permease [Lentibacillus sp. N15]|uniref:APC family permease n=1 Tax=Lentibacillus songyuanensis TaxID=3136161 RepID=UPI0031BB9CB6
MKNSYTFDRSLGLPSIIFFGLAYMTPMGLFTSYGIVEDVTNGMTPAAYIIALIVMSFTIYGYGQMVKAYPVAGSTYTYAQKSIHPNVGFIIGWAFLLDYAFASIINSLVMGLYLNESIPSVPIWGWIVLFLIIIAAINYLGIKIATNINAIIFIFQILVLIIFSLLCIRTIVKGGDSGGFSISPFFNSMSSFAPIMSGAAILCMSFLGFDSITTLSEETKRPKKNIPKAMFLIIIIGAVLFTGISYLAHSVFPDYDRFKDLDVAGSEIAFVIGGNLFSAFFLSGMIVGVLGTGIASVAGMSRLLFAMGRDSVIPKRIFGYIHPKYKTPTNNIIIICIIALSSLFIDLTTAVSLINFGAFVTYTAVNISVISHYYIRNNKRTTKGTIFYLVLPVAGAGLNLWMLSRLSSVSLWIGSIWIFCGLIYLAMLTRLFTRKAPELQSKPDQSISHNSNFTA